MLDRLCHTNCRRLLPTPIRPLGRGPASAEAALGEPAWVYSPAPACVVSIYGGANDTNDGRAEQTGRLARMGVDTGAITCYH